MSVHREVSVVLAEMRKSKPYYVASHLEATIVSWADRLESALSAQAEPVAWEISAFGTVQVIVRREDVAAEHLAHYQMRDPKAECHELVRRAHAAPVVTEEMVERALNAQPFADDNDPIRVWQLIPRSGVDRKQLMRAALTAALEPDDG